MILLISPEEDLPNEIEILHQLFEAGLEYFHFRKPNKNKEYCQAYLNRIDAKYIDRVVLHNHHDLTSQYAVKGIHMEERIWRAEGDELASYVSSFKTKGFSVSSSYHEPEDLEAQLDIFNYYILSPVFAAISKSQMDGRGFDVRHIPKFVAGMGGINASTTPDAIALGFQGVGALGGVWNSPNPLASFVSMKNAFFAA